MKQIEMGRGWRRAARLGAHIVASGFALLAGLAPLAAAAAGSAPDSLIPQPPTTRLLAPTVYAQDLPEFPAGIHASFDSLLKTYVTPTGVRYAAWAGNKRDRLALTQYIDWLQRLDPSTWPVKDHKAYWINLYNAATLRLVLQNYPLKSLKDLKAPWDTKAVSVAGADYSLNGIENKVLRPKFKDPRIHFSLNCAAVGCPPLRSGAYTADSLDRQINDNCRRTFNDPKYLSIRGFSLRIPRLFDWYSGDFGADPMNIREFIARYVPDFVARQITDPAYKLAWTEYDWSLNRAAE